MERENETVCDVPLLMALPLLYKQVMSSADLKQYGLTKTHIIILSSLGLRGTLRMSQIAEYISSSKEQATRAVAVLVDEGYVERLHDTENRTRIYVRLTEAGGAFLDRWREEMVKRLYHSLNDNVTPEEQEELQAAARSMIRILSKLG